MNLAFLNGLKQAATSKAGIAALTLSKNSPTILFGVGVVGVVGTVVLASRSTLKLPDVLDKHDEGVAKINHATENLDGYTSTMRKKDLLTVKSGLVVDVCKLYAPATILGIASIAALTGSHVILSRRNAALGTTLAALDKAFKEYRGRVVADQGELKDKEYMYGSVEREVYDGETKKGEPIIKKVKSFGDGGSPYSVVFDEENLNWQTTPAYNVYFLRMVQNQLNDKLRAQGYLFLNEAYHELGFPETQAGQVTGWLWGDGGQDEFVDFCIWTPDNKETLDAFQVGRSGAILLDFNVDGPILQNLPKWGK